METRIKFQNDLYVKMERPYLLHQVKENPNAVEKRLLVLYILSCFSLIGHMNDIVLLE